jgi:hypothetical protein
LQLKQGQQYSWLTKLLCGLFLLGCFSYGSPVLAKSVRNLAAFYPLGTLDHGGLAGMIVGDDLETKRIGDGVAEPVAIAVASLHNGTCLPHEKQRLKAPPSGNRESFMDLSFSHDLAPMEAYGLGGQRLSRAEPRLQLNASIEVTSRDAPVIIAEQGSGGVNDHRLPVIRPLGVSARRARKVGGLSPLHHFHIDVASLLRGISADVGCISRLLSKGHVPINQNVRHGARNEQQPGKDHQELVKPKLLPVVLALVFLVFILLSFYFAQSCIDEEAVVIKVWRLSFRVLFFAAAHFAGYWCLKLLGL